VALEIAREAAAAADPGQRAFDDPSFWQDLETDGGVGTLDDVDDPGAGKRCGLRGFWALLATVREDAFDEREQAARALIEHQCDAVAVLNVGGMNGDAQQQAERVDQDVALATRDLLASIITLRVERRPPFCAALPLWLSMIATRGLASRPACSRTAT
jgi:hypothetical protein